MWMVVLSWIKMSPTLQAEVAITMHAAFMLRVVFLSDVDYDLLAAICMALKPITYAQGEPIGDSQVLYVMRAGVTLVNNCVYRVGGCWGEDILLDHPDLVSFYSGFAMTYVEASAISRKQLNDVLLKFPEQSSRIRRHKVQLAVQRTLMRAAQERLLQMMLTAGRKESLLLQKEQQQQLRDSTGENINGDVGLVGGDANTNPSTFQSQQQAQQLRSNSTNYRASATQSRSYAILKQKWKNSFFSFRIENRQEQMNLKQFHSTRKAVEEQNELCTKHVIESMLENVKTNILTEVNGYVREKIEKQRSKSAGSGSGGPRGRSSKRSGNIANSEEVENEEMGALQDLTDAGSSPVGGGGPHFQATTSNAPAAPVAGPRSRTSGSSKKTKTPPARDPPPQAPPPLVKIPKVVLVRDVQAPRVDLAEKNASTTTSHQMQQNKLLKPPAPPPAPMLASLPPGAKTMQRKETSTKSGTESFEPKLILEDEEEEAEASFFQVAGRGDDSSDE
ncbi:unnamed protein product [Amoebophrya sp. A120]|nr:unnamed protein product [Amoebophrya sp. A120]|eukprot:GSA120T00007273001.1